MSTRSHDQYVFGARAANADDRHDEASAREPVSTAAWTVTGVSEVAEDDELSTLCSTVAQAMTPAVSTAVVLVTPARPSEPSAGVAAASIATSSASTGAVVRIEWLLHEGPVRTSLESGAPTVSSLLAEDGRWPRFARAVPAHDTVSVAAVPVPLPAGVGSGVLAAYSQDPDAFDPRDVRFLAAFARVVADVVGERSVPRAPETAEPSASPIVNQAVGVLITHHCDEEQALRRLARISESTHQPLAAAAQMIVREAQTEAHLRFVARSPRQHLQTL